MTSISEKLVNIKTRVAYHIDDAISDIKGFLFQTGSKISRRSYAFLKKCSKNWEKVSDQIDSIVHFSPLKKSSISVKIREVSQKQQKLSPYVVLAFAYEEFQAHPDKEEIIRHIEGHLNTELFKRKNQVRFIGPSIPQEAINFFISKNIIVN